MLTVRAVMKEGETSVAPAQREANILIELLRDLEVPSRNMSLEFNCYELRHAVVLLHRIRNAIGPMPILHQFRDATVEYTNGSFREGIPDIDRSLLAESGRSAPSLMKKHGSVRFRPSEPSRCPESTRHCHSPASAGADLNLSMLYARVSTPPPSTRSDFLLPAGRGGQVAKCKSTTR